MFDSGNLELLTTDDAERWRRALDEIGAYSFQHLPAFHRLAELRGEGKAIMPVFRNSGHTAAFPLLIRDIDGHTSRSDRLRDATSVSGFAGPLASGGNAIVEGPALPEDVRMRFLQDLQTFFEQNRVVSVFSRLSPVLDQRPLLDGLGEIVERGVTVAIDLTVPPEQQFARYRRGHRQDIMHLRDWGYSCQEVGADGLDDFVRIYGETMERVGAEPSYRFERAYFEYLVRDMGDVMHLFVCKTDNEVVSAAIAASCGGIAEVYLSGTAGQFLHVSPVKLLRDSIRVWACENGARIMHVGGGVGARRDSLYHHKMGFGANEHTYCTWRLIVDQQVYDDLSREAGATTPDDADSYFPRYRDPALRSDSKQDEALRER